jgi:hypothetical protein
MLWAQIGVGSNDHQLCDALVFGQAGKYAIYPTLTGLIGQRLGPGRQKRQVTQQCERQYYSHEKIFNGKKNKNTLFSVISCC